ncbi:sideroflexin-2-like [Amphiura filiformis]|uniref:sideroflexin-2-like n=1 Tax=Amphiura filiformis TaxID=82378 RepID=UPI003B2192B1
MADKDLHLSQPSLDLGVPQWDQSTRRLDLGVPRWNQSTFIGRFKHFLNITDMRLGVCSDKELEDARNLLNKYRLGVEPPGTTEEQLWYAQKLYMSAFHPDSGQKQNVFGRMSFQVPGGMILGGAMLTFYRTMPAVVFWQWVNQSFNALVNYTNRNAASTITNKQIGMAYVTATSSALLVAMGFNSLTKKTPPLVARYVPFVAVAAANCVNIPMMRQQEVLHGITVYNEQGQELGKSKKAANKGIVQVILSRISMTVPGMCGLPIVMERLLRYNWFRRATWSHVYFQTLASGAILILMVPVGCALFPQKASIAVDKLEPDLREEIYNKYGNAIQRVYFNKGL